MRNGDNPAFPESIASQEKQQKEQRLSLGLSKADQVMEEKKLELESFADSVSTQKLQRDRAYVDRLHAVFTSKELKKEAKYGKVLEALILDLGELASWLGENTDIARTTEYDDWRNKVDVLLRFKRVEGGEDFLGMAVDATVSYLLRDKFDRIVQEIEPGHMGEVHYVKKDWKKGRLDNLPRVVVGVDPERVDELMQLWLQDDYEALAASPVKKLLLTQIASQLQLYHDYANKYGKRDWLEHIDPALKEINSQLALEADTPLLQHDSVSVALQSQLQILRRKWAL